MQYFLCSPHQPYLAFHSDAHQSLQGCFSEHKNYEQHLFYGTAVFKHREYLQKIAGRGAEWAFRFLWDPSEESDSPQTEYQEIIQFLRVLSAVVVMMCWETADMLLQLTSHVIRILCMVG